MEMAARHEALVSSAAVAAIPGPADALRSTDYRLVGPILTLAHPPLLSRVDLRLSVSSSLSVLRAEG